VKRGEKRRDKRRKGELKRRQEARKVENIDIEQYNVTLGKSLSAVHVNLLVRTCQMPLSLSLGFAVNLQDLAAVYIYHCSTQHTQHDDQRQCCW